MAESCCGTNSQGRQVCTAWAPTSCCSCWGVVRWYSSLSSGTTRSVSPAAVQRCKKRHLENQGVHE